LQPSHKLIYAVIFWSMLILIFIALAEGVKAGQVTTTKKPSSTSKSKSTSELNRNATEVAEEYAYLLEQLLYLSSDYCRYFDKVEDKASAENYKILAKLCTKLSERGKYDNINKLMAEIDTLKQVLVDRKRELEKLQSELDRQSANAKLSLANQKTLKLTSSLHSELAALDEQLERDVVRRIHNNGVNQEQIQKYVYTLVDDSLMNYIKKIGAYYSSQVRVVTNKDGKNTRVLIEMPESPQPVVVNVPDQPSQPIHVLPHVGHVRPEGKTFEGITCYREFRDSAKVGSSDVPIYVVNSIGDIEISSWPHKGVSAYYSVGIAAEKPGSAEEFGNNIRLRVYPKLNKIYVESVVPQLDDPKTRIVECHLELLVPADNKIFIDNSSGNITVSDVRNNFNIKSTNCSIDMKHIDGNLEVVNSSGTITVDRVSGSIIIQNRMGPVSLSSCIGTMKLDNSSGDIDVADCEGDAVIHNTGGISVGNHIGNLDITNRSGPVDVANLDGNLVALNSFEAVTARNVSGSAKLVNANADVEAMGIKGQLNINNRYGDITASSLSGPINIENKNGNIDLQLTKVFSGASNVISNGGVLLLSIAPRCDLLLSMESINGNIDVEGFTANIHRSDAGMETAQITLGKGSNVLAVKASNSRIEVKPFE